MTNAEREQSHPNVRPKDAATLILVDRSSADAESPARQAPSQACLHAGQIRLSRRARGAERPADADRKTARQKSRKAADAAGGAAERGESARAGARRHPRDIRGNRIVARRQAQTDARDRRRTGPGPNSPKPASIPICPFCILSRARSRRRGGRAVSTRVSSRSMRRRSRTGSTTSCIPRRNSSNWSGCRSTRRAQLDLPTITNVVLQELEARVAAGFGHDLPVPFYRMPHKAFTRELL